MLSQLPEDVLVNEFLDKLEVPELLHILATNKEWKEKYSNKFQNKILNYQCEHKLYTPVFIDQPEPDPKHKFEGNNEILITYQNYKTVIERYKHSGGPNLISCNQLNSDIKAKIDNHLKSIRGKDLYQILNNYLVGLNFGPDLEFWFGDWNTREPFNIEILQNLFSRTHKVTLNFMRSWYYDVLLLDNFIILKMLEYIFAKYGNNQYQIDHYEINEIDDSSFMRITISYQ